MSLMGELGIYPFWLSDCFVCCFFLLSLFHVAMDIGVTENVGHAEKDLNNAVMLLAMAFWMIQMRL
ncbi:hypothetical protein V8J88_02355 [Massilia sp. W12]|uniref:hypothetical protein n=1 Tax=Massilia sp. W12 TaxID=3126507 RepID=UPI0030D092DB